MKFYGLALLSGAIVLGACAGGEKKTEAPAAAPAAAPGAAPAAPGAPVTGKTIEVQMIGDAKGYHFVPNAITLKAGDAIKFINVIGFPHNVGFDPATTPADVQAQLSANMPGDHMMGALEGPMMLQANETYVVSFAGIKPGTYNFHCTPHLALGMKGTVTVQ
jgi:plastocyanin